MTQEVQPVLALLPGLLCDARAFGLQMRALRGEVDCRVVDMTLDDTLGAMADRVLAEMPERFALAGFSMGGYVALEVMRRLAATGQTQRVTRLALLDSRAVCDGPGESDGRRRLIAMAREGRFEWVLPELLPKFVHRDRLGDAVLMGTLAAMAAATGPQAFIRQQQALIAREDCRPVLGQVTAPTLVVVGDADALTPPERAREMADGIAGAELEVIADSGHFTLLERPDAVTAALRRWLGL